MDFPTSGHFGTSKVCRRIRPLYWWKNMRGEIKQYVNSCTECALRKGQGNRRMAPLRPIPYPEKPNLLLAADLFTLSVSDSDDKCALVMINHCSKYLGAVPLATKFSIVVAEAFESIVNRFDSTQVLLTDQGTYRVYWQIFSKYA